MPGAAWAASPIVNTTIELRKTGSEPFNTSDGDDDCTDGNTFDTAKTFSDGSTINDNDDGTGYDGKDTCADNDVVRLGDSVTYKVEISVNDSDVDYLTSIVTLDPYNQTTQLPDAAGTVHQEWINIPSGCEEDPLLVTPISELRDTDGDGYNETLFCNMGFAREGTNKVFFPAAKILGTSTDGSKATLNDSIAGASVTAEAISNTAATGNNGTSAPDTAGPSEVLITADFRVNLTKEMVGFGIDGDGNPIWPKLDPKPGPAGEDGYLAKFDVKAVYQKGSMIADSPDELSDTDGDGFFYDADFDVLDIFTDDNTNNDTPLSSGTLLYTWDAAQPACSFNGNNGAGATVTCTQTDYPIDWSGPSFGPDGADDPNYHIDLDNIDTRDPDGDGTLFSTRIHLWIPKSDVDNHQTCGAGSCQFFHINEAQALDTANNTTAEFAPVSTEDASGNNLNNYGTGSEPGGIGSADQSTANSDNITNGLLQVSSPGSWTYRKTFQRTTDNSTYVPKIAEQLRAKNEELPMALIIYDYRLIDGGKSQVCDKIDTTQYEFAGVPAWDKWPVYANRGGLVVALYYDISTGRYPRPTQNNPSMRIWGGTEPANLLLFADAQSQTQSLYSAVSNGSGSLADLDTTTCEDDVDGDGQVNIVDAAGVESNPGNPIDWYEDHTMVPAAADGTNGVTKIRFEYTYNADWVTAEHESFGGSGHKYVYTGQIYDLKVRADATGYGPKMYMPNYADARRSETGDNDAWLPWQDNATDAVQDPNNVAFGYNIYSADRNILVPSGISVGKKTVPEGLKVVRGGDIVKFEIQPTVFGLWSGTETGDVIDNLPPGTNYIGGSEEFSVDGGATWMDYTTYQASSPDVTLTSSATPGAQDPITWSFGSLEAGDQMPRIRYSVEVDPTLTSGNFKNTVTFRARGIAADKLTVDTDDDGVGDTGNGVGDDVTATYKLTILPKFGFDVLKAVSQEVYNVNENFFFDLTYKNLGGESYTGGDFIDILPFQGDALTTIGGIDSVRDPATDFNGIYTFEGASFSNNEVFFVTDEDPATLNLDPCASSNTPAGYVPVSGDLCYQDYINNGNQLPDGVAAGTDSANWQACTTGGSPLTVSSDCPIDPIDITAVRFQPPSVPTSGGKTVSLELKPIGNFGGDPVYTTDANGIQIVDWANSPDLGDVYTNSFGGRIPEISLNVISNDVSVTPVWGSVGDYVWWDDNQDGVQDASEDPIEGVDLQIFDDAGDPIYIDPATGTTVYAADKADYEAITGNTVEPYIVTTIADGSYLFENLPAGDYTIEILNIPGNETYDLDDGLAAADSIADFTLDQITDPITGNIIGVEDKDDVDFGYIPYLFDLELQKAMITPAPYYSGQEVEFQITIENKGPDPAQDIEVTDSATGLAFVATSEVATQGTYTNPLWEVGTLTSGQTETLNLKYTITATNLTDPVFNFAEITADGDFGSDIDSQPDDNTSGTGPDPEESEEDVQSGTDTHDDEAGVPLTLVAGPDIKITKTAGDAADGDVFLINADGTVTFTYLVENTGGMDLSDITITDDAGTSADVSDDQTLTSTQCADLAGPLAPGATVTCTLDLTVDQADSPYTNSAGTTGTPTDENGDPIPGLDKPEDDDPAQVFAPPAIKITKTAGDADDGENYVINQDGTVTFTYLVENTGGTYLTDITITDDAGTASDTGDDQTLSSTECADLAGPLAPTDTVSCTLELDVAGENYENSAGTSGTPTNENGEPLTDGEGNPLFDDPEDEDNAVILMPGIQITKTAGDAADGEALIINEDGTVTFTYLVENSGGTFLTDITITDDAGTASDTADDQTLSSTECAELAGPLAPAATVTCTLDLTVDQADSPYTNNAQTTGTPTQEDGTPYEGVEAPTDEDPSDIFAPPAIKITKTAGDADDGENYVINQDGTVTFTYLVENTGGTYLTDITITDDAGTASDTADDETLTSAQCADLAGPLAPTDTVSCTLELDVAGENYENSAGTSGTPTNENGEPLTDSDGNPLFDNPEDDDDAVILMPGIKITKTAGDAADGGVFVNTDGTVTFTYLVENSGGTFLTDITITDDAGTASDTADDQTLTSAQCADLAGPLAPTDTVTCTLDLEVVETPYTNNATTEGTPSEQDGTPYEGVESPTDEDEAEVLSGDGTISGTLWVDRDGDGRNDDGEPLGGVDIEITYHGNPDDNDPANDKTYTVTTNPDGTYSLDGLPYGDYWVMVVVDTLPEDLKQVFDEDGTIDNMAQTTLTKESPNSPNHDFAYNGSGNACSEKYGDIDGYIYIDANQNGKRDSGEEGIKNVTVYLKDADGNVIAETETNSKGKYEFGNYPPGDYTVDLKESDKQLKGYTLINEDGDLTSLNGKDQIGHGCDSDTNTDFGYYKSSDILAKTGTNMPLYVLATLLSVGGYLIFRKTRMKRN